MPKRETMAALAAAAAELNAETDSLNQLIEAFNAQLRASGIGITHWYEGSTIGRDWLLDPTAVGENDEDDQE